MARPTFTKAQKAEAILLLNKGLSGSAVCEKVGCSIASLQNWKKEFADKKFSLKDVDEQEEEWEEEEETTPSQPASTHKATPPYSSSKPTDSKEDFIKSYWKTQSVDTVMDKPETIDDVVGIVNDALTYAYRKLAD